MTAVVLTHWHPDHVLGLNQLCESVKRHRSGEFRKVPFYCTLPTYEVLRSKSYSYEMDNFLQYHEVVPCLDFEVDVPDYRGVSMRMTPVPVAHGNVKGAVIYAVQRANKKVVFCWDIDVPGASGPRNVRTNLRVIRDHVEALRQPDLLFMASNTWRKVTNADGRATGHTSYELAQQYIEAIGPKRVLLVHLSGHEDSRGAGWGWRDRDWDKAASPAAKAARQGMVIGL